MRDKIKIMLDYLDILSRRNHYLEQNIESGEPIRFMGVTNGVSAVNVLAGGKGKVGAYIGGWQTNAMKNRLGMMFPDMLYVSPEEPGINAREINHHLLKAEKINPEGVPFLDICMLADLEQGWDCIHKTKLAIEFAIQNGINLIHIEDQGPKKRCGHLGDKELNNIESYIEIMKAANITIRNLLPQNYNLVRLITRTDAYSAKRIVYSSMIMDQNHREHKYIDWEKGPTPDGKYLYLKQGMNPETNRSWGMDLAIQRCSEIIQLGLAHYIWMETPDGDLEVAKEFIIGVQEQCPYVKGLYNHSPSFDWDLKFYSESQPIVKELCLYFENIDSFQEQDIMEWIQKHSPIHGSMCYDDLYSVYAYLHDFYRDKSKDDDIIHNMLQLLPKGYISNSLSSHYQNIKNENVIDQIVHLFVKNRLQQFGKSLYDMGYILHLITLPEFHVTAYNMYVLSHHFSTHGIYSYVDLVQRKEQYLATKDKHYTYLAHQSATGTKLEADFAESIGSSNHRYLLDSTESYDQKRRLKKKI